MVPESFPYILWIPLEKAQPIWSATLPLFPAQSRKGGFGTMVVTAVDRPGEAETPAPPPHAPARMTSLVLVAFAAVYLVWGSTYLAIRVGIESFPPLILAGLRHLTVGLLLFPFLQFKTGIRPTAVNWRTAVVTGFLLLFVGNGGVSWAEQTVPSGVTALLVATVSLWLVIVDWVRPGGTRPVARVLIGLLLGFAGMVLLVGPASLGGAGRVDPRGAGVLVIASLAWACGSLYSKHGAMPSSPLLSMAMQSFAGGVILMAVILVITAPHPAPARLKDPLPAPGEV